MTRFESAKIEYLGHMLEISYFIRPGKKETIVWLHGLGSTKNDFLQATRRTDLADFTILAADFPGCGNSSYPDSLEIGMTDLVEITFGLLSALKIESIILVGHSMGGLVALLFAQKYPNLVRKIVDVEGNLAPEDCEVFSRHTSGMNWEEFLNSGSWDKLHDRFNAMPYFGSKQFADGYKRSVSQKVFHTYCCSIVETTDNARLLEVFTGLKIPRLFVHGDSNAGLSYLSKLQLAGVEVRRMASSNHWPHNDNPEAFFTALSWFLTGKRTDSQRWKFNRFHNTDNERTLANGIKATVFSGKNVMLSFVNIEPCSEGVIHSHSEEQWGVLIQGECVRIQDGEEVTMITGDLWYTPSNTPHGIRTGESGAVVLDIFSPPRDDYKRSP